MTGPRPVEGQCTRCKQPRTLFPYKPEHDCVRDAGYLHLDEAAEWIDQIRDEGDRWCEARIDRLGRQALLCVPCHDREAEEERQFIKENQL